LDAFLPLHVQKLTKNGRTPLSYAVAKCRTKVVSALLDKGASVGEVATVSRRRNFIDVSLLQQPDTFLTPLHLAADTGNKQIVSMLLAKGADTEALDKVLTAPLL
jgi:ankyrin repeat protein